MSLTDTPSSERVHIAFFGKRNAGKSSLVNAVTGQELSIVSEVLGTTTDPVKKAMELLPLGPCVIIDTPGFDDEGLLGEKRIVKTKAILAKTDIAVLAVDSNIGLSYEDKQFTELLRERKIPYIVAYTKSDICKREFETKENEIKTSSQNKSGIFELKEKLAHILKGVKPDKFILNDIVNKDDIVVLVTPIDSAAPKGRLILPQQQTLREILDLNAVAVTCQTDELQSALSCLAKKPRIVITDSQDFERVAEITPEDIPLTSFSLLFARYKGTLDALISGVHAIDALKPDDKILISEGCTHHRQCEDIGTVKIPKWIEEYTGVKPDFRFTSGTEFPDDLSEFAVVIHCGGCMLNEKEMQSRIRFAEKSGVPIINYGALIAKIHGIFDRAVQPLVQ